jgi:hypothetical protein
VSPKDSDPPTTKWARGTPKKKKSKPKRKYPRAPFNKRMSISSVNQRISASNALMLLPLQLQTRFVKLAPRVILQLGQLAQQQIQQFNLVLAQNGSVDEALIAQQKDLLGTLTDIQLEAEHLQSIYRLATERAALQAGIIKTLALNQSTGAPDAAFLAAKANFIALSNATQAPRGLMPSVNTNLTKASKSTVRTTIGAFNSVASQVDSAMISFNLTGKTPAQITPILQTLNPLISNMLNQVNLATNNNGGQFGFAHADYNNFKQKYSGWVTKINAAIQLLNAIGTGPAPIVQQILQAPNLHVFLQSAANQSALSAFAPANFGNYQALLGVAGQIAGQLNTGLGFSTQAIVSQRAMRLKNIDKARLSGEVLDGLISINNPLLFVNQPLTAVQYPLPPNTAMSISVVPALPSANDPVYELWVRVMPDQASIHQFDASLSETEINWGKAAWEHIAAAKPMDEAAFFEAWKTLYHQAGSARSAWIFKSLMPTNLAQIGAGQSNTLVFPTIQARGPVHEGLSPRSMVMPDNLVLLTYRNDVELYRKVSYKIPKPLLCGPNLNDPNALGLDETGNLTYSQSIRWMFDFKEAVRVGMGFRLKVDAAEAQVGGLGFDRVVVCGIRQTNTDGSAISATQAKSDIESYIDALHYSYAGFELLKQGTATNNTGSSDSALKPKTAAESFVAELQTKPYSNPALPASSDGAILASALGIAAQKLDGVQGADNQDTMDAVAMNTALWSGTMGNYLHEALSSHVLGERNSITPQDIKETKRFFTQYVSGRGSLPAIRIGKQPYGILPTMHFKLLEEPTNHTSDYYIRLYELLVNRLWKSFKQAVWGGHVTSPLTERQVDGKWKTIAQQLKNVDAPSSSADEYQARFMQLLGLLPRSSAFFVRYGLAVRGDYALGGILGLLNNGSNTLENPVPDQLKADIHKLFALCYDKTPYKNLYASRLNYGTITGEQGVLQYRYSVEQTLLGRLVFTDKHAQASYSITKEELSALKPLAPDQNYIRWLLDNIGTQLSGSSRKSFLESSDNQEKSLLYLLLKQSLVLTFWEESVERICNSFLPDNLAIDIEPLYETTNTAPFQKAKNFAANDQAGFKAFLRVELKRAQSLNISLNEASMVFSNPTAFSTLFSSTNKNDVHKAVCIWNISKVVNWYAVNRILLGRIINTSQPNSYTQLSPEQQNTLNRPAIDWLVGFANGSAYYQFLRPHTSTFKYNSLVGVNSWSGKVPAEKDQDFLSQTLRANRMYYMFGVTEGQVNTSADTRNMFDFIHQSLRTNPNLVSPELKAVIQAMDYLVNVPTARLDRAFSEHLDLCSHRLDAWILGLASKKLADIRKVQQSSTYFGAYAFVENLRPGSQLKDPSGKNIGFHFNADGSSSPVVDPDIQGYIHAPSMLQAAAAAVLRAGYLASGGQQMQVNLSSARVRKALSMLQGINTGIALGELLGYDLERSIEASNDLALLQYLPLIREAFPLSSSITGEANPSQLQLVDGLKLISFCQTPNTDLSTKIAGISAAHQTQLRRHIDHIHDSMDAVGDLLLSEGVLQYIQGNYERAGASMKTLSEGTRPPLDYDVVKTPQPGYLFPHRVMVCEAVAPLQGVRTYRAIAEPNLCNLLHNLCPDWNDLDVFYTYYQDQVEAGQGSLNIKQSGLSIIDIYHALLQPFGDGHGYLDTILEYKIRTLHAVGPQFSIKIQYREVQQTSAALLRWLPVCRQVAKLVQQGRPLDATDLLPGGSPKARLPELDWNELKTRLIQVSNDIVLLYQKLDALANAGTLNHAAYIDARESLEKLWLYGDKRALSNNVATKGPADYPDHIKQLLPDLQQTVSKVQTLMASISAVVTWDETNTKLLFNLSQLLFGDDFQVFPVFRPHNAGDLALSQSTLQINSSPAAPMQRWLNGAAKVREKLAAAEHIHLFTGRYHNSLFNPQPIQLPYRPNDSWIGMELPQGYKLDGEKLSIVMFSASSNTFNNTCWGIMIDEWHEIIPDTHLTTGLAIHYDQPNAEAPQAILLAVHSGASQEFWTDNELIGAVNSTFDLVKIRTVEPDHFNESPDGFQIALPAILGKMKFGPDKINQVSNLVNTMTGNPNFYQSIHWQYDEDASDVFTNFGDNLA